MGLNGLSWVATNAGDIHLLPGLVSPQLKRLLRPDNFNPSTGVTIEDTFSNMPGVTVSFVAQFLGAPDKHGVKMDKDSGEVTVAASLPAGPRLRSFIITATAKEGATTVTARIRVYIHGSISKVWLTPERLTLRKDAKNMRFSVLAQFDDLTIGDITNWSPFTTPGSVTDFTFVHASGSDKPVLDWSVEAGTGGVSVDPVTGELRATSETGARNITAKLLGKTARASLVCAKSWSTPLTLTHLSGPGAREAGFVPNILFLPDGFVETEKTEFERLVRFVVGRLSSRNRTRPFSALTGRINYFYGWVASPDSGVSVLNELDRHVLSPTTAEGDALELPSVTRGPSGKWSLENLINEVGLPTSTSDPIISVLDSGRIDAWQKLYGPQVTEGRVKDVFQTWLSRNDRVILNERDTAFHMAFGSRPALDEEIKSQSVTFNPRRVHNDDFDSFLKNLRGPTGLGLPDIWSGKGKDNRFIVIVCRSNHRGGVNVSRDEGSTVGVSFGNNLRHRMEDNKLGNGFDLTPDRIPTDPNFHIWLTITHELGHSCGLGDEYGGLATAPPPSRIAETANEANLQDRQSLLLGTGDLSTDKLKWGSWPRIAKAGVLVDKPHSVAGGKFELFVQDLKATRIKSGDVVRLRTRPLAKAAAPSPRFKVESVTDRIVIAPLFGAVLDPNKFPKESIVMVPVRGPDSNPAADLFGADLPLVDDSVLLRIVSTQNPLNSQPLAGEAPAPNDAGGRPCKNNELKVPTGATNFPNRAAPNPPQFSSWTIGIYENGGQHNCGIYRPTGVCLMSTNAQKDPITNEINMNDYCLICRYAIVDALDPTQFEAVEVDFMERYGKRGKP